MIVQGYNWADYYRLNANAALDIRAWSDYVPYSTSVTQWANYKLIRSSSVYAYFIPTKSKAEWLSFIANKPSDVAVYPMCDANPAGTYMVAEYYAGSECGAYPECPFPGAIVETSMGGNCGLKRWRHTRCGVLYGANWICHGDPCITAESRQTDWGQIRFCTGTYDAIVHKCMYTGSTLATVNIITGQTSLWLNDDLYYLNSESYQQNNVPQATWGTCNPAAPCGDAICSTEYGETCASCSADCGACPLTCSDYYYESACTSAGCYWDSDTYDCSDTPSCSSYSNPYSCAYAGCIWDDYSSRCYSE
ncbi:MAG: hypothetical protein JW789_01695 [Candidatus Aenigmarchaeota archaeon]|nr:hypothetical protein [Candidatus Aenigmarchaeota archaeon]